jgi:peroxiredoxin
MKRKTFKNLQLLILCLIFASCQKQNHYHIIGNLQGIPDSTVIELYIQYEDVAIRIATDTIINGLFAFSDTTGKEMLRMSLQMSDMQHYSGVCDVWVGNSDIRVSGNSNYLSQWKVNSKVKEQKVENIMLDQTRSLRIAADSLRLLRMDNSQTNIARQEISSKIRSINRKISVKELEFIKNNYNSLISVMELNQIAQFADSSQMKIIKEIFSKIDTKYSNTLWGEGIKNLLNKVIPPHIGDRFIDLSAKDLLGKSHKLSDYSGKYVLLDFGMFACGACILTAPETRRLSEKYKKELYVIGINLDTRKELWEKATRRDSITWINLSDGKGTFGGAFIAYGIEAFPTYILIDPKGIIIDRWLGSQNSIYFEKLSKYLEVKN